MKNLVRLCCALAGAALIIAASSPKSVRALAAHEPTLNYAGWKFWLGKLEEFNGDFVKAEMVKAFITSDEYRHRFGQ